MLQKIKEFNESLTGLSLTIVLLSLVGSIFLAEPVWKLAFEPLFYGDSDSYLYIFSFFMTLFSLTFGNTLSLTIEQLFKLRILKDLNVSKDIKQIVLFTFFMTISICVIIVMMLLG